MSTLPPIRPEVDESDVGNEALDSTAVEGGDPFLDGLDWGWSAPALEFVMLNMQEENG
jgi:hypothetical protein